MGVLIYLPERSHTPRRMALPLPEPAQILFFTGVRYVRHEDRQGVDAGPQGRLDAPRNGSASDTPRPRRRRG
jgi:hypothetical protein